MLSHLQDDCLFLILKRKTGRYDRAEIRKVSSLTISVEMKEVFGDIQLDEHEKSSSSSDATGRQSTTLLFQSF